MNFPQSSQNNSEDDQYESFDANTNKQSKSSKNKRTQFYASRKMLTTDMDYLNDYSESVPQSDQITFTKFGSETQYQSIEHKIGHQHEQFQSFNKMQRRQTAMGSSLRLNGLKEPTGKPKLLSSIGNMMFGIAKTLKKSYYAEVNEFTIDPQTSDLSDLFNYDFNEPNSCFKEFKEGSPITQSQYIFLEKFRGVQGLIQFLKSGFGSIRLDDIPNDAPYWRSAVTHQETKGIYGSAADIEFREQRYGKNEYPTKVTKSFFDLIYTKLNDNILKVMLASSLLSIIIEWQKQIHTDQYNTIPGSGWLSGATILVTFVFVCILESLVAFRCQNKLDELQQNIAEYTVSVYRDNNETISIPIEKLVVGDIYRIEKGDIIPADSILIQVGHQLDEEGLKKPFEQTKDKTIVVREANVHKRKNVIKDTNVKDFLNQFKGSDIVMSSINVADISNILYAKSLMLKGQGIAIACAVGGQTQIGISEGGSIADASHIVDEKLEFRDILNTYMAKVGIKANIFGLLFMILMLIRHWLECCGYVMTNQKPVLLDYNKMLQIIIITLTLIIAVIPESLDLAVLECISMLSQVNLCTQKKLVFRKLSSLTNMGNVDCLVLEKNGTFTESNDSKVVQWWVCGQRSDEKYNAKKIEDRFVNGTKVPRQRTKFSKANFILECIWFGSRAWVEDDQSEELKSKSAKIVRGNSTEQALLKFILENFWHDYIRLRKKKITVLHWKGYDPDRKRSTIIMQEKQNEEYRSESDLNADQSSDENDGAPPPPDRVFIYSKGAPEEILKICDQIYTNECSHYQQFDQAQRDMINEKVDKMQKEFQRVIIYSLRQMKYEDYKQIEQKVLKRNKVKSVRELHNDILLIEELEKHSTLIGLTGIKDTDKPRIEDTLSAMSSSGIQTIICTGDSINSTKNFSKKVGLIAEQDKFVRRPKSIALQLNDLEDSELIDGNELKGLPAARDNKFNKSQSSRSSVAGSLQHTHDSYNFAPEAEMSKKFTIGQQRDIQNGIMDAEVLVLKIEEYEKGENHLKCQKKHLIGDDVKTKTKQINKQINKLRADFKNFIDNIKIVAKCNVTQRWLLAKQLRKMDKITCLSADSIGDTFALEQAHVGMTMKNVGTQVSKSMSDLIIDDDIQILLDSIKFGRNIFENIRKFLQFQVTISINLMLYVCIGSFLFSDFPVQPAIVLWINFLMDTFASITLAGELPKDEYDILARTNQFRRHHAQIYTRMMKFTIISSTIYQQIVMYCVFYNGSYLFSGKNGSILNGLNDNLSWSQLPFSKVVKEGDFYIQIPTQKCHDYTMIYNIFFMMQIYNIFICRKTYEKGGVLKKTKKLIYDIWASEDRNARCCCFGKKEKQDEFQSSQTQLYSEDSPQRKSCSQSLCSRIYSIFGEDESHGNGTLKMNQIESSERRAYSRMFFLLVIMVAAANVAIIQQGFKLGLQMSPLTLRQHLWCNFVAILIIPWHWLTKRIVKLCYDVEHVQEWHTVGEDQSRPTHFLGVE